MVNPSLKTVKNVELSSRPYFSVKFWFLIKILSSTYFSIKFSLNSGTFLLPQKMTNCYFKYHTFILCPLCGRTAVMLVDTSPLQLSNACLLLSRRISLLQLGTEPGSTNLNCGSSEISVLMLSITIQWNPDITLLKGPARKSVIGGKTLYAGNEFRALLKGLLLQ